MTEQRDAPRAMTLEMRDKGTGRTGRTNRRDPIYETHMYGYDIMRSVGRWFSVG
jgi:hypothetical protein